MRLLQSITNKILKLWKLFTTFREANSHSPSIDVRVEIGVKYRKDSKTTNHHNRHSRKEELLNDQQSDCLLELAGTKEVQPSEGNGN